MLNLKDFMEKVGVTKKCYVDSWIDKGLIPGAKRDLSTNTYTFLDSSRRPYQSHALKAGLSAEKIRAHIVKASIMRQHITASACFMSLGEFQSMIHDLSNAGLIQIRTEDEVEYYDSTTKSSEYSGKSLKEVCSFVQSCIKAAAEGVATAYFEKTVATSV